MKETRFSGYFENIKSADDLRQKIKDTFDWTPRGDEWVEWLDENPTQFKQLNEHIDYFVAEGFGIAG